MSGDRGASEAVAVFDDLPAGLFESGTKGGTSHDGMVERFDILRWRGGVEADKGKGAGCWDAVVGAVEVGDTPGVGLGYQLDVVGAIALLDPFAVQENRGLRGKRFFRRARALNEEGGKEEQDGGRGGIAHFSIL